MKNKMSRQQRNATLCFKEDIPWEDLAAGRGIPTPKHFYTVIFRLENDEEVVFTLSEYEFHALQIGDQGMLTYVIHKHYNEMISFGEIIKEFQL